MKILVTGSTGFIGGYLVKQLVQDGHEVICIVRKTSNIELLRKLTGVVLINCDITNASYFSEVVRRECPEVVFHCAAVVMEKDEEVLNKINVGGTSNVCLACLDSDIDRMIYVSSVAVVSGNKEDCLTDEMSYSATNAYGRSKIRAEKVVRDFRKKGLSVAIIRPSMVYGIGEPHLLYKIFGLISKRLLFIPEISSIDSKLQLVFVENVVDSMLLAMKKEEALTGTFLIADKEILTIKSFLSILYEYLQAGVPPVLPAWISKLLLSLPGLRNIRTRLKNRTYEITRAERLLGYDPSVSTEEGLRQTAEQWMKLRANNNK